MLLCLQGLVTEALQYTIPQQVAGIVGFFLPIRQSISAIFFLISSMSNSTCTCNSLLNSRREFLEAL